MAVAVGLVTITYVIVDNANVAKAANTLDTAFNKARVQSMAKGTEAGKLTVWMTDGTVYYTIGDPTVEPATAVNNGTIGVNYTYASGTSGASPAMPQVTYRFNSAGMVIQDSDMVEEFEFSHGTRKVAVIFYLDTGKHTTELR